VFNSVFEIIDEDENIWEDITDDYVL